MDDTLLDFKDAENQALHALFSEMQLVYTPEIEQTYQRINQARWKEYELGNMSSQEVVNGRFGLVFQQFDKQVDSIEMEKKYRSYLNKGHKRLENSLEVIRDLSEKVDLYIVTNGVAKTQYQRLTDSELLPYFKDIFISEIVGAQKPHLEFFDYAFSKIPAFQKERTAIIGDSLSSDIQGGINAGIDTIWLHSKETSSAKSLIPSYHIATLGELYTILEE